ncbi:NAD(P)H-dependent oxidoreductase [Pseudomonas sp. Z1-14]|uniref:NAD(P)H-dependent oxidoreductase n=1 Tax=Pseudomonas sp. Z1-14 TaxID=2817409 RepID=UPI003DA8EA2C
MKTLKIAIVVGNPKPQSRTLKLSEVFVEKLMGHTSYELEVIDLADCISDILTWPSERMDRYNSLVAASDLAIFATPTYKASFTGLLKAFLDRYPANGLSGLTAIPLFTGGDLTHAMAPTTTLSPLLAELGAVVPGRGIYFVMSQMDRADEIMQSLADEYASNFNKLARIGNDLTKRA